MQAEYGLSNPFERCGLLGDYLNRLLRGTAATPSQHPVVPPPPSPREIPFQGQETMATASGNNQFQTPTPYQQSAGLFVSNMDTAFPQNPQPRNSNAQPTYLQTSATEDQPNFQSPYSHSQRLTEDYTPGILDNPTNFMPQWYSPVSASPHLGMGPAGRLLRPLPSARRLPNHDGGGAEVQVARNNELSTDSPEETEDDDDERQEDDV
jgi:hypothetical protein